MATGQAYGETPLCDEAEYELKSLDRVIELRRAIAGSLPDESEWFEVLVREHLLDAASRKMDPWGRPYVYRKRGDTFELFTLGPDGEAGTADDQVKADRWKWRMRSGCARSGCTNL
jgi:Type II secretion system (T2SS), protein G